MKSIQQWFERLAGITQDELDRIALAARVFSEVPETDVADFGIPACWRRGGKVEVRQGAI